MRSARVSLCLLALLSALFAGISSAATYTPAPQSNQQMVQGLLIFLAVVLLIIVVGVLMNFMKNLGKEKQKGE